MDVFQQLFRGIPAIELDVDGPARGQERFQRLQDRAGQVELAPKAKPVLGGAMAIEPPYCLVAQIEPQVDCGRQVPGAQGAFEVAKGFMVAGTARGGICKSCVWELLRRRASP